MITVYHNVFLHLARCGTLISEWILAIVRPVIKRTDEGNTQP